MRYPQPRGQCASPAPALGSGKVSFVSRPQRDYVKLYRASLRGWKDKLLPERNCHELAEAYARERVRLGPDEQRAVDDWLNEQYPVRLKPKHERWKDDPPSPWDKLPGVD